MGKLIELAYHYLTQCVIFQRKECTLESKQLLSGNVMLMLSLVARFDLEPDLLEHVCIKSRRDIVCTVWGRKLFGHGIDVVIKPDYGR